MATDLARIKRNVAKMVGMGAPEAEIDQYIAGEGVTVEQVRAFNPGQQTTDAKPGTKEYAIWARDRAIAGQPIPQVSANPGQFTSDYQDPSWERAALLPMETNRATGERRWAVPQIGVDIGRAFTLPGDVYSGRTDFDPRNGFSQQDPDTLDRAANLSGMVGASAPMAGRNMVQASARDLVNANGQRMPRLLADDLQAAGIHAGNVNRSISDLGPGGMLLDISPLLQGRAAKLASMPEAAQTTIVDALTSRRNAAGPRIRAAIERNFGPDPVPSRIAMDIEDMRRRANSLYEPVFREKALSSTFAFDAEPLARAIDAQMPNFVGETRARVASIRGMLVDPRTGALTQDPQLIAAVRSELDGVIGSMVENKGNRTTIAALRDLRRMIDDELADAIPALKSVDAARAGVEAQQEAFDLGRTVLKTGDNALHPVDLEDAISRLSGPQGTLIGPRQEISIAPRRLSQGVITEIYRIVGTNANDRLNLRKVLTGDGKWNYEKLVTVFGQDRADRLLRLFENEGLMAQSENLALGGSKTGMLAAGGEGLEAGRGNASAIRSLLNMDFGDAALRIGGKLTGGATDAARRARNVAIADALISSGGWRYSPRPLPPQSFLIRHPATSIAAVQQMLSGNDRR